AQRAFVDAKVQLTRPRPSANLPRMRLLAVLVAALALGTVATGCRKKPAAPPCIPTCEQRSKELNCARPDKCREECAELERRTVCRPELDNGRDCFLNLPKEKWFCDDEGTPPPFIQSCQPARPALEACLRNAFNSPNPPKTL